MAISITRCCLNVFPRCPTPGSDISSSNSKAFQVERPRDDKWRRQCVLGMASMIVGLSLVNDSNAIGKEFSSVVVTESNSRVARWSDKRMCPPWHANSLETIVPENLPRPSAHRRWEAIGFSKNAPAIEVVVVRKARTGCFFM